MHTGVRPGYQPEAGRGALYPNEVASDFAFIPFGGGARKCIGDQFALFEATVAFAMLLRRYTFRCARVGRTRPGFRACRAAALVVGSQEGA